MTRPKTPATSARRAPRPKGGPGLRQIEPGWYLVGQQLHPMLGAFNDVGRLQVVSTQPTGATIETWMLYLEQTPSGGGVNGNQPRYPFHSPGSDGRELDCLSFQVIDHGAAPTGIKYQKIVAHCDPPIIIQGLQRAAKPSSKKAASKKPSAKKKTAPAKKK